MIVARLIKVGSPAYVTMRKIFGAMDGLMRFKPERWVGLWCIILSGTNVAKGAQDRWFYWDFSTLSITLTAALILGIVWGYFLHRFPAIPNQVISVKSGLVTVAVGFVLFAAGTIEYGFGITTFISGLPYLALFMAVWIMYGVPIHEDKNGDKSVPLKKDMFVPLLMASVLVVGAGIMGFMMDDPMVSTGAVVYAFFPLVALTFSAHVRHIQRARIYGLFIPAIFLCVRFPWFLVPMAVLFWGLRFYHYFRHGYIYPTFKVDWEE